MGGRGNARGKRGRGVSAQASPSAAVNAPIADGVANAQPQQNHISSLNAEHNGNVERALSKIKAHEKFVGIESREPLGINTDAESLSGYQDKTKK
jgi:hypothetical protein